MLRHGSGICRMHFQKIGDCLAVAHAILTDVSGYGTVQASVV